MGKTHKASRKHRFSKRVRSNREKAPSEAMSVSDAVKALKGFEAPKFDQTVEVVMHLGIDPKQADQAIRGSVALPKGIGKSKRVIAFCKGDAVKEALDAGAIKAGGEELVAEIEGGFFDFDVAVASPDMMRVVSKLGKVLGPKGLMPSPKAGTVTQNVGQAVTEYAAGKIEYRNDKGGNVHAPVGKMSFSEGDLSENITAFVELIERARPNSTKGRFIKSITVSGTMTPGVRIQYSGE
ncbi:MAG: 50S ribosomal protein L1 [Planctomycetota bacterium]|jgi:large subunit ribosomal protein L1